MILNNTINITKLIDWDSLTDENLFQILDRNQGPVNELIKEQARTIRKEQYENRIFIRGLIEISNYCVKDCTYCGIRRGKKIERYRLSKEDILNLIQTIYDHGIHTVVLQGGEDKYFTDDVLIDLLKSIKMNFPLMAITLSLGERSADSYGLLKKYGADRYLLRHETKNKEHYSYLHPDQDQQVRLDCLDTLKALGYQTGAGFMVGSPMQTPRTLVEDLLYLKELQPEMIGIGPFVATKGTPLESFRSGTVDDACLLVALARILVPTALIPATTALQSLDKEGYKKGLQAGANVIMINVMPERLQKKYRIYDNKLKSNKKLSTRLMELNTIIEETGCTMDLSIGHHEGGKHELV